MSPFRIATLTGLLVFDCLSCPHTWALDEKSHVAFTAQSGAFPLAQSGHTAVVYLDARDWPGVARAVTSFADDVKSVTGSAPQVEHTLAPSGTNTPLLIIGTIGHSAAIDDLIARGKLHVDAIRGHWEMSVTQIVTDPVPGVTSALVIAGADKRGTIFGVYDLSAQIGVSPWSWWADVPIAHHDSLFVTPGSYVQPEPRVKYRGIFLNDESPALSGWAQEKFGGKNHEFYVHVFELLLRLKANFLWPAMWDNAFNEDDPADPALADEYGVVMGTSHHEPMMRAQQEWKRHGTGPWDYTLNRKELNDFWRFGVRRNKNYEELTTIGMRGDGDMAMSAETNTRLLETIVADQRKILSEEVNRDVTKVPQVWALYKEVQGYYEKGMRVPDDVTLLWCDDNWGNIRRLPTAEERKRPGGAGIYYHFDYVGDPRSYKWLLTYNITKIWEQMHLAVDYGADRVWIVNVGDLKPMEFPIEFFLDYARTPERWGADDLQQYTIAWATRQFGPEHAHEIASLIDTYTRYNSRRKPEMLEPTTYSLTEDHEADRIDRDWRELTARAERLNALLPDTQKAAFFELVLYPLKASATVGEMYIAAGRNRLYAKQGRTEANTYAAETQRLFAEDAALTIEYNHKLLNGKWNHMMDQTHIGYTFWNEPPLNTMPAVQLVQPAPSARMAVFGEGSEAAATKLSPFDSVHRQVHTLDIANRGTAPFNFIAKSSASWVKLDPPSGTVRESQRLSVSIDWSQLQQGKSDATITIEQEYGPRSSIALTATKLGATRGFVESDGVIAVEAEHASALLPAAGVQWRKLPGFGETLSGMEAFPDTAPSTLPGTPQACMSYDVTITSTGLLNLQAVLAPTLPFQPRHGLRYSIALDGAPQKLVEMWPSPLPIGGGGDWSRAVADGVRRVSTPLGNVSAGPHTLSLCRVDPGVVVERLVIFRNKVPQTYLGPEESRSDNADLR